MTIIRSDSIAALTASLAIAQGKMEAAKKDADNPFFKSKYADLASVWDACRAPLSENKLAVIQLPGKENGEYFVDTILSHSSGEFVASRLVVKPVKDDPQGLGSAITYARRYGLQAMVGIAPEEDDGEDAMGRGNAKLKQREQKPATPPPESTPKAAEREETEDEKFNKTVLVIRNKIGKMRGDLNAIQLEEAWCVVLAQAIPGKEGTTKLESFTREELKAGWDNFAAILDKAKALQSGTPSA